MDSEPKPRRPIRTVLRAVIEIAFIVFLFYSNLLMGEFTRSNEYGKTLAWALVDVMTPINFTIAMISATIGYGIFEYLRRKF